MRTNDFCSTNPDDDTVSLVELAKSGSNLLCHSPIKAVFVCERNYHCWFKAEFSGEVVNHAFFSLANVFSRIHFQ